MAFLEMLTTWLLLISARLGVWVLAALLIATIALRFWVKRRRTDASGRPSASMRLGLWAVALVQVVAIAGLVMTLGPGRGMVRDIGRLQQLVDQPVPEIRLRQVSDDAALALSDLHGQVVLLNLWATWCPPCRTEMPALGRVQDQLGPQGLAVVTVSNESRDVLQRYETEYPSSTRGCYTGQLPDFLSAEVLPTTLLIDREGILVGFAIGAHSERFFADWARPYLT